jgi:HlyD family secretion protein
VDNQEKKTLGIKKKVLIGCGAALAVVLVGAGIWRAVSGGNSGEGDTVLYADSVGMLTGTGLGTQNRFSGTVEAQDTMKLMLSEDQKVKEIFVEKGQEVEAGTKLFEYDTEELSMSLEQGNLELEKITNSINNLNTQIAALNEEKKSAPASEQLSYTTQIQELQTNVKQEEYNYKVKELEVNRTKKSLESSVVTSTIAGIIQEINEEPGYDQYTGEKEAFMSILSTGKYRIKGKISEQNIGNLYPGMQVIVHSRVDEDEIWMGVVDSIDTEKPETSQSAVYYDGTDSSQQASRYPFYVTLETSDGLMLGQHVYIEPNMGQSDDSGMWLMSSYIVDADSGSPYVWLAGSDDKLEKHDVSLGEYNEEMDTWEILSGLKGTDYIVWPSEDCKKGAAVVKNTGGISGGMSTGGTEVTPEDGAEAMPEDGSEVLPEEGAEVIPEDGAEVIPEDGTEEGMSGSSGNGTAAEEETGGE